MEKLENFIAQENIPLVKSLIINQYNRDDIYIYRWSYTQNEMYTVKSGYWIARNMLYQDQEAMILIRVEYY